MTSPLFSLALTAPITEPSSSHVDSISSSQLSPQDIASLKRRITTLEVENTTLLGKLTKKPMLYSYLREGRAVRRLVALVEPVLDMITENDRRQSLMVDGGITTTPQMISSDSTPQQERTYKNFLKLLDWCPVLRKLLVAGKVDIVACREGGADAARGDDASTLKGEIVNWLGTATTLRIDPPLSHRDKEGRGFNHLVTGQLLCPVDYNWTDSSVRMSIREYDPNFCVTAHSWPSFLYPDGTYNPTKPAEGLFQGELLVRAFKCIFTSPGSARHHTAVDRTVRSNAPRSRNNVAALLGMKAVEPRAIAYVAVQVRFALSSCSSWAVVDEDFNHEDFYYNIVDYFEAPCSEEKSSEVKKLLLWWNRVVFGRQNVSDYHPISVQTLSVARSRK